MRSWIAGFTILLALGGAAEAYLLTAEHIFNYCVQKRENVHALEIKQTTEFLDTRFPEGRVTAQETLYLAQPGAFRIDGRYSKAAQTWVNQAGRALIITDGAITEEGRYQSSLLRELFLARKPEGLSAQLRAVGINVNQVVLGRKGEWLVYIIGAPEGDLQKPQLWIGKESFRPARLIFFEKQNDKSVKVDMQFEDYGKKTIDWYPGKIEIYLDDLLAMTTRVDQTLPRASLPASLFDFAEIKRKLPLARDANRSLVVSSTRIGETFGLLRRQY